MKQKKRVIAKNQFVCGMFGLIEHDKYDIKWQKRRKIQTIRYREKEFGRVIGRH